MHSVLELAIVTNVLTKENSSLWSKRNTPEEVAMIDKFRVMAFTYVMDNVQTARQNSLWMCSGERNCAAKNHIGKLFECMSYFYNFNGKIQKSQIKKLK